MIRARPTSVASIAIAIIVLTFALHPACRAQPIDFVRNVRPILQQHCYTCHGSEKQKSSLRLDIKSEAFKGGDNYGPSILANNPIDSPLLQLVTSEVEGERMPPEGERLSGNEIAILKQWVAEGANWPDGIDLAQLVDRRDHWSFKPLAHAEPPNVQQVDWPRSDLDRFVLARLEQTGLHPAPAADRVTWLRRVSFDLIGLPPTPEQVTRFVGDQCEGAFARVVDELLDSPRYGERWAQHWLDVVRYADTHGFEVNTERPNAWHYRDYVINAFNSDTPYSQFVREQIAGDSLGQVTATGFLITASVLLPAQIGKDEPSIRLARQDSIDEIVANISQTFLGLSITCARCHDHKFDPISAREYYEMQAFVAGVEYGERDVRITSSPEAQLAFAGIFRKPDPIYLLNRGDPEQPQIEVAPAVPSVLGKLNLANDVAEADRRLALADWIANPNNPLAARVMVNRIWQGHFGTGIVETTSDLGRSGSPPSHPGLLDWLASEFIRSDWSIKQMHRKIVLSSTYRQSTQVDPTAAKRDADCRLLWRFPMRRLEAEIIRDSMLAVSGSLNLTMFGRGFDLFDKRGGLAGFLPIESFHGDGLRRMIYAHKVRRERDAVFGAFDCPDAGQSTSRRRESTTPIQALNLFNSRFTIDQASTFATRVATEAGDDINDQVRLVFMLALNREPNAPELADCAAAVTQTGLPTLCRVVFNSNEFLFMP